MQQQVTSFYPSRKYQLVAALHYSSNGKMTKAGLYLWRQNTKYVFFRLKVHDTWCYCFYGLRHKMAWWFCLEVAIGLLPVTRLEKNAEFATLAAQSWYSCRRVLFSDKDWICKNCFGYGSGVKKSISAHLCQIARTGRRPQYQACLIFFVAYGQTPDKKWPK